MNISYLFSLPLLTKELIEQAQHKRTYILRVIYAVVLYSLALWQYDATSGGGLSGFANLGLGRIFFWQLVMAQIWAIMLLLPAITCSALTVEKEKDTLALLLLTKLSPWTIVFEKLLSRIFAMGTYQLLSLPLFGIVQSMGGVETWEIIAAILALMLLSFAVGSVSILCSTWFRTTSEAFIMAYLSVYCLSCVFSPLYAVTFRQYQLQAMAVTPTTPDSPPTFFQQMFALIAEMFLPVATGILSLLLSTSVLWVASKVLVPRAFVSSWNVVLVLFQRADRFFNDLNAKTTGGIVLVSDRETLPLFQPIAWRETRKKSLGTFRYQFRVLMVLLTPLILVISAAITDSRMEFSSPFRMFPVFFWFVSLICLTIHSTGVIPAERIRQTLDVLLVAPLSASEIVNEKLAGVRRLIKVLSVPFAVLIIFQAVWTGYIQQSSIQSQQGKLWYELISMSLSVAVYMPLIMWIGFQFGLRMKTQIQAVLSTFFTVTGICLIPSFLFRTLIALSRQNAIVPGTIGDLFVSFVGVLSPLMVLGGINPSIRSIDGMTRSLTEPDVSFQAAILIIHFTFYGTIWLLLRRNAIRSFSRFVRRLEPESK